MPDQPTSPGSLDDPNAYHGTPSQLAFIRAIAAPSKETQGRQKAIENRREFEPFSSPVHLADLPPPFLNFTAGHPKPLLLCLMIVSPLSRSTVPLAFDPNKEWPCALGMSLDPANSKWKYPRSFFMGSLSWWPSKVNPAHISAPFRHQIPPPLFSSCSPKKPPPPQPGVIWPCIAQKKIPGPAK